LPGYVVPARPTVLEGDYTDWTIYDSFADTDVQATKGYQDAIVNKDETKILLIDANALKAKCYTIATKTLDVLSGTDHDFPEFFTVPNWARGFSAYGTYAVSVIFNNDGIRIYKNGAVVKSFTYTELGMGDGTVYSVGISPLGKYVVVSGYVTALTSRGWVVLVGS